MTKEKIIQGLDALSSGTYTSWKKTLPVSEKVPDYIIILEAIEILKESEPVIHGHWIYDGRVGDNYSGWNNRYRCSNCGSKLVDDGTHPMKFCGECGARMEGKNETII